jgi:hypothetical protein
VELMLEEEGRIQRNLIIELMTRMDIVELSMVGPFIDSATTDPARQLPPSGSSHPEDSQPRSTFVKQTRPELMGERSEEGVSVAAGGIGGTLRGSCPLDPEQVDIAPRLGSERGVRFTTRPPGFPSAGEGATEAGLSRVWDLPGQGRNTYNGDEAGID